MTGTSQTSLDLLFVNVNGLGQKAKRLTFFSSLIDGSSDIIVLRETHKTGEQQGIRWTREGAGDGNIWPGRCLLMNSRHVASREVAILIGGRVALEDTTIHPLTASHHHGRMVRANFTWQQRPLTLVAAYTQLSLRQTAFPQGPSPASHTTPWPCPGRRGRHLWTPGCLEGAASWGETDHAQLRCCLLRSKTGRLATAFGRLTPFPT